MAEPDSPASRPAFPAGPWPLPLRLILFFVVIGCVIASFPLIEYGRGRSQETRCQTNLRWLATSLWLYAQDYDGGFPPAEEKLADSRWRTWIDLSEPYRIEPKDRRDISQCPANPVSSALNPRHGYPYKASYAFNRRFHNEFAPGPFSIFNLEIPERTVLLVESGRSRATSPFGPPTGSTSESVYGDISLTPLAYPSPHRGRMNIAAADGHAKSIIVRSYSRAGHDPLYGRIGGQIYNWNGGHPNGRTELPPLE